MTARERAPALGPTCERWTLAASLRRGAQSCRAVEEKRELSATTCFFEYLLPAYPFLGKVRPEIGTKTANNDPVHLLRTVCRSNTYSPSLVKPGPALQMPIGPKLCLAAGGHGPAHGPSSVDLSSYLRNYGVACPEAQAARPGARCALEQLGFGH